MMDCWLKAPVTVWPAQEATVPNMAPKSNGCEVIAVGWEGENFTEAGVLAHICIWMAQIDISCHIPLILTRKIVSCIDAWAVLCTRVVSSLVGWEAASKLLDRVHLGQPLLRCRASCDTRALEHQSPDPDLTPRREGGC